MEDNSSFAVEFTASEDGYQFHTEWMTYDVPVDIDCAVGILVMVAHQLIDCQPEQEQKEFEKDLMKMFKESLKTRFENIEPV